MFLHQFHHPPFPPIFYSQCFPFTLASWVTANITFLVVLSEQYKSFYFLHKWVNITLSIPGLRNQSQANHKQRKIQVVCHQHTVKNKQTPFYVSTSREFRVSAINKNVSAMNKEVHSYNANLWVPWIQQTMLSTFGALQGIYTCSCSAYCLLDKEEGIFGVNYKLYSQLFTSLTDLWTNLQTGQDKVFVFNL